MAVDQARPAGLRRMLEQTWSRRGPLALILWPVSLVFATLIRARRFLYRTGLLQSTAVPAFVIVVGNVMAGGTGKTPVVIALVKHLCSLGLRAGVVSRGYGRRNRDCLEVTPQSSAQDVGDEPALIQRLTSVPVFVAARRVAAATALLRRYPATQVIVCDDGLQHYALQRDVELCLFDDRATGNGLVLPAGPLREPWPRKVDWVLHSGENPPFAGYRVHRRLADHAVRQDGSTLALTSLVEANQNPLMAVAAIALPDQFFAMLRNQGLPLKNTMALPDHYSFDSWQRSWDKGYTLLCTEKDAAKLWRHNARALAVPLVCEIEDSVLAALNARLELHFQRKLSSTHGITTT